MEKFDRFIRRGDVKDRTPNPDQAESLMEKADKRLSYIQEREITEENASLILEDAYEAMREAVDSLLVKEGYKSYSHEASISFAEHELEMNPPRVNRFNQYRKLRNDSKYRGEKVTVQQSRNCLELAREIIPELKKRLERELGKEN